MTALSFPWLVIRELPQKMGTRGTDNVNSLPVRTHRLAVRLTHCCCLSFLWDMTWSGGLCLSKSKVNIEFTRNQKKKKKRQKCEYRLLLQYQRNREAEKLLELCRNVINATDSKF